MVCLCNTVNWLHFLGIVAFELRWFVVCLAEGCVWILRVCCLFKVLKFITAIVICYFEKLGNNKSSIFRTRDNLPATRDTRRLDYLGKNAMGSACKLQILTTTWRQPNFIFVLHSAMKAHLSTKSKHVLPELYYKNRDYFMESARVRDFHTSWCSIWNRTSERSERVRFLILHRVWKSRTKRFPCCNLFISYILRFSQPQINILALDKFELRTTQVQYNTIVYWHSLVGLFSDNATKNLLR